MLTRLDRNRITAAGGGDFLPSRIPAVMAGFLWSLFLINAAITYSNPTRLGIVSTFITLVSAALVTYISLKARASSFYYLRKWGYLDDAKDSQ
jgi:hypothetical protein